MVLQSDHYTYRVTWSNEDQEYIGLCAEFPSMSWLDSSHETALQGIRRLIADCVADMVNNDESIPQPLASKSFSGKFMVRIPPENHRELATKAAESGISINRLVSSMLAKA